MSDLRKQLIAAARQAGDMEYAAHIAALSHMFRRDILVRLAYYK